MPNYSGRPPKFDIDTKWESKKSTARISCMRRKEIIPTHKYIGRTDRDPSLATLTMRQSPVMGRHISRQHVHGDVVHEVFKKPVVCSFAILCRRCELRYDSSEGLVSTAHFLDVVVKGGHF